MPQKKTCVHAFFILPTTRLVRFLRFLRLLFYRVLSFGPIFPPIRGHVGVDNLDHTVSKTLVVFGGVTNPIPIPVMGPIFHVIMVARVIVAFGGIHGFDQFTGLGESIVGNVQLEVLVVNFVFFNFKPNVIVTFCVGFTLKFLWNFRENFCEFF